LLVAGIGMTVLSAGLFAIGKAYEKSKVLFEVSEEPILFGLVTRKATNFEIMIRSITDSMALGPLTLVSMVASIPVIMGAGLAMAVIAGGIATFAKTIEKAGNIKYLAGTIGSTITVISQAFGALGGASIKDKIFSKVFNIPGAVDESGNILYTPDQVQRGIESVQGMGDILVNVAEGVAAFANMEYINSAGKTVSISPAVQKKAIKNIKFTLATIPQVFGELGAKSKPGALSKIAGSLAKKAGVDASLISSVIGTDEYGPDDVQRGIESVMGIGEVLIGLSDGVISFSKGEYMDAAGQMQKINFDDFKIGGKATEKIKSVLDSVSNIFGSIGGKSKSAAGGVMKGLAKTFNVDIEGVLPGTDAYSAEDVEKGIQSLSGVTTILGSVSEFIKSFSENSPDATVKI